MSTSLHRFTRRRCLQLAAVLSVLLLGSFVQRSDREAFHLIVLHTNDVHGQCQTRPARWLDREDPPQIGGLARVAAYVNSVRSEALGKDQGVLVVDAGDWFQGTPEGQLELGDSFMQAMSKVGYDALCVGNHDMDHGLAHLSGLIERNGLPAVLANVYERESGERPAWVEPWRIVDVNGFRVGLVGVLTKETPTITHPDATELIRFVEPAEALLEARKALAGKVDFLLPLTHQGVDYDIELAKAVPDFPILIGGHSHTYLGEGVREGDTTILQAGSKASAVGRLDLWFDSKGEKPTAMRYQVVDLLRDAAPEDRNAEVESLVEGLIGRAEESMKAVLGTLAQPLRRSRSRLESSTAGNFITDVMREASGAQLAIQNRGGIRCDLEAGPLTRRNAFEFLPFGNNLTVLDVTGAELTECLRRAVEEGEHAGVEFSGLRVGVRPQADGRIGTLVSVEFNGKPVDPEVRYRVATNSFLARGGDGYWPESSRRIVREEPAMLREVLEAWLQGRGPVTPSAEQRYVKLD